MDEEDLTIQNLYKANKQQQQRIKKLEAVIDKYARHTYECNQRYDHEKEIQPCDCGFEQALKGGDAIMT